MIERTYLPIRECFSFIETKPVLIHVLGGGYAADDRLAAWSQLSQEGKGRLIEAIRLMRCDPRARLVCSGNKVNGDKSMAATYREAAISLGVDLLRIITLEAPASTREEANELALRYGKDINLLLVKSALHMEQAMMHFKAAGITPLAAPANYMVKDKMLTSHLRGWLSLDNIHMIDAVIHEYLGTLKSKYFN